MNAATTTTASAYNFPNEYCFRRLVENKRMIKRVIFHDPTCQVDADYAQLLSDIVALRERLYKSLPRERLDPRGLIKEDRPYICILATGNYEFVVAALAVLAIGAAMVPLAPAVLPQEACYFLSNTRSELLLTSTRASGLGLAIGEYANARGHSTTILPISAPTVSLDSTPPTDGINIDESLIISASRPSLILFTSGSTGPPKGVVHSRRFFSAGYFSDPNDIFLTHRPVHWIGGLRSIINLVVSGTKQEVIAADEAAIWERLKQGGITMLCCVIPLWCKLMNYYHSTLSHLPMEELELYVRPARELRVARIGGAAPQPSLLKFWREHIGVELEVTYGCTETGGPGMVTDNTCDRNLECSLGKPEKGVIVRLSDGDEGEILIKNPMQFSHYLNDPGSTRAALTEDGFFRTGDNGHRIGDEFFIEGRTSTDFVRFHGFKVPVIEVEMRILELPFVEEACIVSVPDAEASTRVAAVVRFSLACQKDLRSLREALSGKLANFKMPTALRVLGEGEDMPMTFTGKVLRRDVLRQFFPSQGGYALPPDVEIWDLRSSGQAVDHAPWDWAGLQGC